MASKRQRRQRVGGKKKPKRAKRAPPPPNVQRANLGLVADPNADLAPKKMKRPAIQAVEWVPGEVPPPKNRPLSEFDTAYITKLVNKYGTDFEKMARDRKLNCDQLTATKLQNMYRKLTEKQSSDTSDEDSSAQAKRPKVDEER